MNFCVFVTWWFVLEFFIPGIESETYMRIHPVTTKKDLAAFIDIPYKLYKDDPVWVPPLRDEQRGQFDHTRNPLLDHCEWQLYLLEDGGRYVGRIAAFIDVLAIDFWKERIGLFGYYECPPRRNGAWSWKGSSPPRW